MKSTFKIAVMATLLLGCSALAYAQAGSASGSAAGQASSTTEAKNTSATAGASASAEADVDAQARAEKSIKTIKERGAKASAKARSAAEAKLAAAAEKVNQAGETEVAARLATEFGATVEAMTEEKSECGCGWGELMIAHTLTSNSKMDVTVDQILDLHQEGMGWGQIAAGMGLHLGETASAVRSEARVAVGDVKADGKVATIHGVDAKAGVGASAKAGGGAKSGSTSGAVGASVGTTVQTGVKVPTPPIKIKP